MVENPRYGQIAPRLPAHRAVEADMAAPLGQERRERPARRPIIALVEGAWNPRIVERRHDQGGNADGRHEPRRPAAIIVVLGAGETITRRDEGVVVIPYRAGVHDRGALSGRNDGALGGRLDLHEAENVAMIDLVARPHHGAAAGGKTPRRRSGRGSGSPAVCPGLASPAGRGSPAGCPRCRQASENSAVRWHAVRATSTGRADGWRWSADRCPTRESAVGTAAGRGSRRH